MAAHNMTREEAIDALALVNQFSGNISAAARAAKIPRNTLQSRFTRARLVLQDEIANAPERERPITDAIPEPKPRIRVKAGGIDAKYRVLAIGDAHDHPDLPKDRFRWLGKHAAALGVDYVVQIGDFFTLDSLNSHVSNETLLGKLKSPWSRDMVSAKEALSEFDRGLGAHKPRKHETLGNHERRAWFYEDAHPEVVGLLTGELLATLEDHGWAHTPYGDYFFLGGVGFTHCAINRLNKTYGGKNAEIQIANDAVFDHVIGHSHLKRDHRAAKLGPSKHISVVNLGCALPWGHVEEYMYHGATTGWWWGCCDLVIGGGHVTDTNFMSMLELEKRYA